MIVASQPTCNASLMENFFIFIFLLGAQCQLILFYRLLRFRPNVLHIP